MTQLKFESTPRIQNAKEYQQLHIFIIRNHKIHKTIDNPEK